MPDNKIIFVYVFLFIGCFTTVCAMVCPSDLTIRLNSVLLWPGLILILCGIALGIGLSFLESLQEMKEGKHDHKSQGGF